jgi:hypothetical protein
LNKLLRIPAAMKNVIIDNNLDNAESKAIRFFEIRQKQNSETWKEKSQLRTSTNGPDISSIDWRPMIIVVKQLPNPLNAKAIKKARKDSIRKARDFQHK